MDAGGVAKFHRIIVDILEICAVLEMSSIARREVVHHQLSLGVAARSQLPQPAE